MVGIYETAPDRDGSQEENGDIMEGRRSIEGEPIAWLGYVSIDVTTAMEDGVVIRSIRKDPDSDL